jgi:heme oxygenase (biliverdin-IX-beta and delta-forming)
MKEQAAHRAAELLLECEVAALGTLHEGAPAVSMVPYAIVLDPLAFVILVSGLSAHTRDMRADPRVGWMIMEQPVGKPVEQAVEQPGEQFGEQAEVPRDRGGKPPHTYARISMQGRATAIAPDSLTYASARAAYSRRFPDMTNLFELGDFALFAIEPFSVRLVAGFAQAHSLTPETLAKAMVVATDVATDVATAQGRAITPPG